MTTADFSTRTGTGSGRADRDPHPIDEPLRFARWQRVGAFLLITAGLLWAVKVGVLWGTNGRPPSLGPVPLIPILVTGSMLCHYAGATALPIPLLRQRAWWVLGLCVPVAVLGYSMIGGTVDSAMSALIPVTAHPLLRLETGMLAFGVIGVGLGFVLLRNSQQG